MSVSIITAQELGVFAGLCVKLKLATLADACSIAAQMSLSNLSAFANQYNDRSEPHSADDVEREALSALASPTGLQTAFGPLVYNCVDNSGVIFYGMNGYARGTLTEDARLAIDEWSGLEKACQKHQERELDRIKRQQENDEAYTDVAPLPTMTAEELKAEITARGATRLIVAEFRVDESDLQTDYFGSRAARRIVIGFGTGSRESFVQMRKAAALFPPTAGYAPGLDQWTVTAPKSKPDPNAYIEREQLRDDSYHCMKFGTKEAAELHVAELVKTAAECQSGYIGGLHFPWFAQQFGANYHRESIEYRENYSMGGGNYLGCSRYSGWKVYQTQYVNEPLEYFEPPAIVKTKAKRPQPAVAASTIGEQYSANV